MNNFIWGALARAINDATTIDEAIAAGTVAHNDDPDAHLGAGQSLTTHRAAEIIDHLAESVVNDKIATKARRYIAIVDPNSETDYATLASAVAYAIGKGGGDIYLVRGTHYVSADIDIPPTIGLYGDGIGETVITSDSATLRNLSIYTSMSFASGYAVLDPAEIGNSTITMVPNGTTEGAFLPGQFVRFYATVETTIKILDFNPTTNVITLDGVVPAFVAECECDILPGVELTNGSSLATIYSNLTTTPTEYYAGMSIDNYDNTDDYKTIGFDGTNQFTLGAPYTGATTTIPAIIQFTGKTTMVCNGISFSPDVPTVRFNGYSAQMSVLFEACENVINSGSNTGVSSSTYIGCIFHRNNSGAYYMTDNGEFVNCVFIAIGNGSYGFQIRGRSVFNGCEFRANGFTNHHWIMGDSKETRVTNCIFESQIGELIGNTVVSGTDYGAIFIGNHWYFEANSTMSFGFTKSMFIGNNFYTSGSGVVTFANPASDNTCVANYCATQITHSMTTSLFIGNHEGGYKPVVTHAAATTACALRLNEVAKLTPNSSRTLTTTVPLAGLTRYLMIITSGTTTYTMTFGTGFKAVSTLVTGAVSAKQFVISFVSDGTNLIETGRTVAMTP